MIEGETVGLTQTATRGRPETRDRILQVAIEAFARDGFDQTSFRGIAEQCGLTDAALYYYYPSKRALLDALWDTPWTMELRPPVDGPQPASLHLLDLVDVMLDVVEQHDTLIRLLIRSALDGDATAIAQRNQTMAYWRRRLLPHFERSFTRDEALLRLEAFLMLVFGITVHSQTAHLGNFPELSHQEAYRDHIKRLVRATILDMSDSESPE